MSAFFKIAVVAVVGFRFTSAQGTEPAKSQSEHAPRFEDYSVAEIFQGTPAAPLLITPEERRYRTRIRNGVSKGEGVEREGKEQPGPNFAGHYIVITWGCGSPCVMMAVVDALTGRVYGPPMGDGFQMSWLGGGPWLPLAEFRQNSLLMVMRPSPALADGPIYDHYFIWRDNRWRLVHRTLVDTKRLGPKR